MVDVSAWNQQAVTSARARARTGRRSRDASGPPAPRWISASCRSCWATTCAARTRLSWRTYVSFIGENKIRPGLFSLLVLTRSNPGIAQIELGTHLGVDKASIVALLDRLERAGLIERRRSTRDRRRQGIFLTEAGSSELEALMAPGAPARAPDGKPIHQGRARSVPGLPAAHACLRRARGRAWRIAAPQAANAPQPCGASRSLSAVVSGFMNQALSGVAAMTTPWAFERARRPPVPPRPRWSHASAARTRAGSAAANSRSTCALLVKAMASTLPACRFASSSSSPPRPGRRRSGRAPPRRPLRRLLAGNRSAA